MKWLIPYWKRSGYGLVRKSKRRCLSTRQKERPQTKPTLNLHFRPRISGGQQYKSSMVPVPLELVWSLVVSSGLHILMPLVGSDEEHWSQSPAVLVRNSLTDWWTRGQRGRVKELEDLSALTENSKWNESPIHLRRVCSIFATGFKKGSFPYSPCKNVTLNQRPQS